MPRISVLERSKAAAAAVEAYPALFTKACTQQVSSSRALRYAYGPSLLRAATIDDVDGTAVGEFASSLIAANAIVVVFDGAAGVPVGFDVANGAVVAFNRAVVAVAVTTVVFEGEVAVVAVFFSATAVSSGSAAERASALLSRVGRPHLPLDISRRASSTSVSVQSDTCVLGQVGKEEIDALLCDSSSKSSCAGVYRGIYVPYSG